MKKTVLGLIAALLLFGCSSKSEETQALESKLVVGKSLADVTLSDQFETRHKINADTTKIIFALNKESAHLCNDFFVTQTPTYLSDHKTQFVADVSAAPSLIRSMFIMPGLKDFKHTVLILDDEKEAAAYRSGVDTQSVLLVKVTQGSISAIEPLNSVQQLQVAIEAK
jgi:hypothetical protein